MTIDYTTYQPQSFHDALRRTYPPQRVGIPHRYADFQQQLHALYAPPVKQAVTVRSIRFTPRWKAA